MTQVAPRSPSDALVADAQCVALTATERRDLAALAPVRVCVDPDWAPYEHLRADGSYEGIAADLFALVAERIGMRFEVVATADWEASLARARSGACHVLPFLNPSPSRSEYLLFTSPVLREPNVFVTRHDHGWIHDPTRLGDRVVALPRGTQVEERLRRDAPDVRVLLVDDEPAAFDAVRDGAADVTLRSLIVAAHALRTGAWSDLRIAGAIPRYENRFCIGVARSHPRLHALLERAVTTLDSADRAAVSERHAAVDHALLRDMATLVEQVRRVGEHLRVVLDAMPNGIASIDADGRLRLVNRAFAAALGVAEPERALGQALRTLGPDPAAVASLDALRVEAIAGDEKRAHADVPLPRADGTKGHFQVSLTPYALGSEGARAVLVVTTDVTERVHAERAIRIQAERDALTGCLNRTAFAERAGHALRDASARGNGAALALIDLDRFKAVNDAHGHAAGDEVLRACARRMREAVRASDLVARLGGDEFAVWLAEVGSSADAVRVAEKLRRALDAPVALDGHDLRVHASIGVALFPEHAEDLTTLLGRADEALYAAKARGRNVVQVWAAPSVG